MREAAVHTPEWSVMSRTAQSTVLRGTAYADAHGVLERAEHFRATRAMRSGVPTSRLGLRAIGDECGRARPFHGRGIRSLLLLFHTHR